MCKNVLIYNSGGGLGDSIQLIPLIESLKKNFINPKILYLGAHENHFENKLKDYKIKIDTLNLNLKYFGFRWWHLLFVKTRFKKLNIDKFDLIIDLQSKLRNTLILKKIPHCNFYSSTFSFLFCSKKGNYIISKNLVESTVKNLEILLQKKIKLHDFNLSNLDKFFFDEAERLLPDQNYVGLSIVQGNVYRKKSWPLNKVVDLCMNLKKNNKTPVFFIEKKDIEVKNKIQKLIPFALFPEHQSNLSSPALVTSLGKRLDFVITIDNGIMHMLALAKVPMISLFGPTDSEKFAPNYKKSITLDSSKIHNTKNISTITVEDVLTAAKQNLNF